MARERKRDRKHGRLKQTIKPVNPVVDVDQVKDDLDINSDNFRIDFNLATDVPTSAGETPVDISLSKDMVPSSTASKSVDSTIMRSLAKMSDFNLLDRFKMEQKRIVHPDMEDYALMNSFREIRTRLLQKSENKNFVLMVVTVDRHMGATFMSVNLGAAFSYEGEKTSLLIDCHHQDGGLSKLLELEETLGLSDYIKNPEIDVSQIIYPIGISRMRLIPFGSSRSGGLEFLTSERMKEFVGVLKRKHVDRYIIINAPPLEVSADAAILSELADFVIVVVPYGKISNSRLKKAIKSIPREKIAGIVMNDCKRYV